jgi:hypothetical protein
LLLCVLFRGCVWVLCVLGGGGGGGGVGGGGGGGGGFGGEWIVLSCD